MDEIAADSMAEVTKHLSQLRSQSALVDHLPEALDGVAASVDGGDADAEVAPRALADGHALHRLGFQGSGER